MSILLSAYSGTHHTVAEKLSAEVVSLEFLDALQAVLQPRVGVGIAVCELEHHQNTSGVQVGGGWGVVPDKCHLLYRRQMQRRAHNSCCVLDSDNRRHFWLGCAPYMHAKFKFKYEF